MVVDDNEGYACLQEAQISFISPLQKLELELVEVVQKKIRKTAAPGWSSGGWTRTAQENLVLFTP